MKYILSFLLSLILLASAYGQECTIKLVNAAAEAIPYANISIYKQDSFIASLITNNAGLANARINRGFYFIKINCHGYSDTTLKIFNDSNTSITITMNNDMIHKIKKVTITGRSTIRTADAYAAAPVISSRSIVMGSSRSVKKARTRADVFMSGEKSDISEEYSSSDKDLRRESLSSPRKLSSGILTGGEINDFSKWTLWQDESSQLLAKGQSAWDFAPQGRFTLQLKNKQGFPLVDISVSLVNSKGITVWKAKTDNTGKAELWVVLDSIKSTNFENLNIIINRRENTQVINIEYEKRFAFKAVEIDATCNASSNVDIAFVVDATGSMGDEINYLKAEMNDVMFKSKLAFPTLQFRYANVFYRDNGDDYLHRTQSFTPILSESVAFIDNQSAGGGGDYEEAVEIGLEQAIDSLEWSENARARILFIILDAPPHNTYETRKKMKALAKKAAAKGIRIIPIAASGINKSTELLMRSMALCTNGTYLFITDHSGIGNSHIKPTTDTFTVNSLNHLMIQTIKNQIEVMDCQKQEEILKDSSLTASNDTIINIVQLHLPTRDSSDVNQDSIKQFYFDWAHYPNPSAGIVYFKSNVSIPIVQVFDLRGKLIEQLENTSTEMKHKIDLSQFANGTYVINFMYANKLYSGKIILIKDLR